MSEKRDIFSTNKFKNVLDRYNKAKDGGERVFFELDDLIDIAEYFTRRGMYDEAVKANEYALEIYPGAACPLSMLARNAMIQDKDIEKAKALADMIEDKDDLEYIYVKAEIMIMEGNYNEADAYLESKARVLDGDDLDDMLLDVPLLFLDYKLPELAAKWHARCEETDEPEYKMAEGDIAFQDSNFKKSERIFKELLEKDPFSVELWGRLAMSQQELLETNDAIESCEFALAIEPNDPDALLTKANALAANGMPEQSLSFYRRFLKLMPTNVHGRFMYAIALNETNDTDEAMAQLNIAKSYPGDTALTEEIIKEQVYIMSTTGKSSEALLMLDEAYKDKQIKQTTMLVCKGAIYLQLGQDDYAKDFFMQAMLNPRTMRDVSREIALVYFDYDDYSKAYSIFLYTLPEHPTDKFEGYGYYAYCCKMLGYRDEFLKNLRIACTYNPNEAKAVFKNYFPKGMLPKDYYDYAASHDI